MMRSKHHQGFSLIETIIVIAIFATLLSLAQPAYVEYNVRSRVSEGLQEADAVKTAVAEYCKANPGGTIHSISDLGLSGAASSGHVAWLNALSAGSDCNMPVVGFETVNTGAEIDPIIALVGQVQGGNMAWACVMLTGEPRHAPETCHVQAKPAVASVTR